MLEELKQIGDEILSKYFEDYNLSFDKTSKGFDVNIIIRYSDDSRTFVECENRDNNRVYSVNLSGSGNILFSKFFEELSHIIYHEYRKLHEKPRNLKEKIYYLADHEYVAMLGRKYFEEKYNIPHANENLKGLIEYFDKSLKNFRNLILGNDKIEYTKFVFYEKEIPDIVAHILAYFSYKPGAEKNFERYIYGYLSERKEISKVVRKLNLSPIFINLEKLPADLSIRDLLLNAEDYFSNFSIILDKCKSKLYSSKL